MQNSDVLDQEWGKASDEMDFESRADLVCCWVGCGLREESLGLTNQTNGISLYQHKEECGKSE